MYGSQGPLVFADQYFHGSIHPSPPPLQDCPALLPIYWRTLAPSCEPVQYTMLSLLALQFGVCLIRFPHSVSFPFVNAPLLLVVTTYPVEPLSCDSMQDAIPRVINEEATANQHRLCSQQHADHEELLSTDVKNETGSSSLAGRSPILQQILIGSSR